MDLVIKGGTVVNAEGQVRADVGIEDGRIVQVGGRPGSAGTVIDATGKLVMPGGVDMHVHLTMPPGAEESRADDFESGTRAAVAGGVTTVGNMCPPIRGELPTDTVERIAVEGNTRSLADFLLHAVIFDPREEVVADIDRLAASGRASVKMFTNLGDFDSRVPDYIRLMGAAGSHGLITLAHCEDQGVIDFCTQRLVDRQEDDASRFAESRPPASEAAAISRVVAFSRTTGAPVYIVHISTSEALEQIQAAREEGLAVFAEVRPIYLFFSSERFAGDNPSLYASHPPLRASQHVEAMWNGLLGDTIDTYCSDHAPWTIRQKDSDDGKLAGLRPGMSELETMLPVLFSRAVHSGRMKPERFVEVTSSNAARIFGIHPRKGAIVEGADADLVVWDPELTKTVDIDGAFTRADFTLYQGWEVTGWPLFTLRGGTIVFADGEVQSDAGHGVEVVREQQAA